MLCWLLLVSATVQAIPNVRVCSTKFCFVDFRYDLVETNKTFTLKMLRGGCPVEICERNEEKDIFDKFKQLLCTSRGALIKTFRSMDRDDYGFISKAEFPDALQEIGIFADSNNVRLLFDALDENKDGKVNFEVRCRSL